MHRHIAALEADVDIFEALLAPLIIYRAASKVTPEDRVTSVEDLEGEDIPVERIVKRYRFTKGVWSTKSLTNVMFFVVISSKVDL